MVADGLQRIASRRSPRAGLAEAREFQLQRATAVRFEDVVKHLANRAQAEDRSLAVGDALPQDGVDKLPRQSIHAGRGGGNGGGAQDLRADALLAAESGKVVRFGEGEGIELIGSRRGRDRDEMGERSRAPPSMAAGQGQGPGPTRCSGRRNLSWLDMERTDHPISMHDVKLKAPWLVKHDGKAMCSGGHLAGL